MTLLNQFTLSRLSPYISFCTLKMHSLQYFPSNYQIFDPITTGGKDTNWGINEVHIKGNHCRGVIVNTETFFQENISQKKTFKVVLLRSCKEKKERHLWKSSGSKPSNYKEHKLIEDSAPQPLTQKIMLAFMMKSHLKRERIWYKKKTVAL